MTKVKICGITNHKDLDLATGYGADAVGFITGITSSPRNISPSMAESLVRKTPIFTDSVLVIYPLSLTEAVDLCEQVEPDAVQIHGDRVDLKMLSDILPGLKIIKSISVNQPDAEGKAHQASEWADAILLDSSTKNKLGGTGVIHDWEISRRIIEAIKPKPVILAGGLNADNVIEAITKVHPYAVDVCTGTEVRPGVKDPEKIQRFLSMVRKADGR